MCTEVTVLNVSQGTKARLKLTLGGGRESQGDGEEPCGEGLRREGSDRLPSARAKAPSPADPGRPGLGGGTSSSSDSCWLDFWPPSCATCHSHLPCPSVKEDLQKVDKGLPMIGPRLSTEGEVLDFLVTDEPTCILCISTFL